MSTKTVARGKGRKVIQTPKKCLWCEEIIEIGTRSPAQYNKIQVHKDCVTSWAHYHCTRKEAETKTDRGEVWCEGCNKLLVRRDNEHLQSWEKRRFCGKSCAAVRTNQSKRQRKKPEEISIEVRSGVKRYIPGTPEFARIAAQYM